MDLAELITLLEAAQEGSSDLSWAVAETIGWTRYWSGQTVYLPPGVTEQNFDEHPDGHLAGTIPPAFTTSIDAALTLVPDSMAIDLHIGPYRKANDATVYEKVQSFDDQGRRVTSFIPHEAKAVRDGVLHWNTPALAVCIAALKPGISQQ